MTTTLRKQGLDNAPRSQRMVVHQPMTSDDVIVMTCHDSLGVHLAQHSLQSVNPVMQGKTMQFGKSFIGGLIQARLEPRSVCTPCENFTVPPAGSGGSLL